MPVVNPDTTSHSDIILTAAGIIVTFLMGILAWLIKRDIGKMDAQFEDVFEAIEDMQESHKELKVEVTVLKTEHDIYCKRCPHITGEE